MVVLVAAVVVDVVALDHVLGQLFAARRADEQAVAVVVHDVVAWMVMCLPRWQAKTPAAGAEYPASLPALSVNL
ncbi:MAG: hypothetical protein IPG04_38435 [Polyangiaceae bacterium]|nr:hypothetical protein [Polyangiaceae bacterium]